MSNIRHAILYIKDSDEYYTQLAYKYINCNARGVRVFYFDKAEYAQFAQAADAYLLCVTSDNKMHKLDIIKDGVRITDSNGSVEISDENIYQPVVSSAKAVGLIVANPVEGINSTVLKSSWNTSYQGKSNISVSAFGSELVSKSFINGKTVELPYNDYIVDYTLKWSSDSPKNAGTYTITLTGTGAYTGTAKVTFKINKAANPLKVKAKTVKVKFSKLKKKAQKLKATNVVKFTKKGQGTLTYKKVKGNKKITINKKTGKVTIKKGLNKGTYKVKVKIQAKGNANYMASAFKTFTFKIIIK